MVSSDTARLGIIRRAKYPQRPPIIRYRDARTPICRYLSDLHRNVNPLVEAEQMLRQRAEDPAVSALRQEDARLSIEVLHGIQRMANQLGVFEFLPAPGQQPHLTLGGVDVSVRADLLVHGSNRAGDALIGGAILRMTLDDADTEPARARRRELGLYVATLARLHVERSLAGNRTPSNRLCMSIDVQHGELFHAPDANARRTNDLENACRFIAAIWPNVDEP
jgi:hypothetical protein